MSEHETAQDGYLSEDRNAQLRREAAPPCRDCRHYLVKDSFALGTITKACEAVDLAAKNGHILSGIMLRLALTSPCPEHATLQDG